RAERRKLTDKEINMAVRTGDEPPRQRLQRLLDEAVKEKPFMRPVLARFARTPTPAAYSRSASSGAVGLSFTA
ncbi:hypothetical protein, partial [Aeromonas caviae]|uniref:hypothetical protein n=1 Tax=Aeromonas caviae TaxID=648 RepID=UPI001CC526CC